MGEEGSGGSDAGSLADVERRLGHRFRDRALLQAALTHRSHAYERDVDPTGEAHYERLEFLGDALLGFITSDWLYRDDDRAEEGLLTRRRQAVVQSATLSRTAAALGLGDAVRLGRGEAQTGGRERPALLADAFEAVLGAIYLDGGIRAARAFVRRALGPELRATRGGPATGADFKSRLQEAVQAKLQQTPRYRIVSKKGPDHALEFVVEVRVEGRVVGRGTGTNRKRAEQEAARHALLRLEDTGG